MLRFANQGHNDSALAYALRAEKTAEKEFGVKHTNYFRALNILALVYDLNNDYKNAAPIYLRALEVQKQISGTDHEDYLNALDQLAIVYHNHNELQKEIAAREDITVISKRERGELS